jgi:UDP-4-amino-4,6-dideoxy-N-acetyl-beta-L-altrosamine transaminase
MIPYGRQSIDQSDVDAVSKAVAQDFLTQGPAVEAFEKKICSITGGEFAVAVNSATSALYVAYRALGLAKGSLLWTTTNTFVATSNAALLCGADVDFVDINPDDFNLSTSDLNARLETAESIGRLPDVVCVVHFAGRPCDMNEIYRLSKKYGFHVVEDASHALGASCQGNPIGSDPRSAAVIFSFHPVKMITTGEGGVVVTHREDLARRCAQLRSHGITRNPEEFSGDLKEPWYFEQHDIGFNFRITDLQCTLGSSQLGRLPTFIDKRRAIAKNYNELLEGLSLELPLMDDDSYQSSWHLYVVRTSSNLKMRDELIKELRKRGVGAALHYIPVPYHPYYKSLGFSLTDYPESEKYFASAISLPIYPDLAHEDVVKISKTIRELV